MRWNETDVHRNKFNGGFPGVDREMKPLGLDSPLRAQLEVWARRGSPC